MSVLVDVVNAVVEFSQSFEDFIKTGVYDLIVKFTAWAVKWLVVASIKAKIAAIAFSWDVAQEILTSLNVSAYLSGMWSSMDSRLIGMLAYLRIPEVINIMLSAFATRFVFRFLGF